MWLITSLIWWTSILTLSRGADILFIFPVGSKSHKNFFDATINVLASNGHKVTVLTAIPSKDKQNIENVVLDEFDPAKVLPSMMKEKGLVGMSQMAFTLNKICTDSLQHPKVKQLYQRKFDLIYLSWFYADCYLEMVHQFQVPYISIVAAGPFSYINEYIGNPHFSSFAYNPMLGYSTYPLSFLQRINSVVTDVSMNYFLNYFLPNSHDKECRSSGQCGLSVPSFYDIKRNHSGIVLNNVRSLEKVPLPYMPNVVNAGGIHCHPSKPLPKEIDDWVSGGGDNGFIYFSLGSAVVPSDMEDKHKDIFLKVLGSLPYQVLWKWDQSTMDGLPSNVKLSKWFPQQDILGDNRLQLFITHGGLLSTQEAIYHGVRVVGLPVMGDQNGNMKRVLDEGWGEYLLWDDLSYDNLRSTILRVVNSKEMKSIVRQKSHLMVDQLHRPEDEVLFFTEYVLRHKGAPHLRSPILQMAWYEVYNVDVWIVLLLCSLTSCLISCLVIYKLLVWCFTKRNKQKHE